MSVSRGPSGHLPINFWPSTAERQKKRHKQMDRQTKCLYLNSVFNVSNKRCVLCLTHKLKLIKKEKWQDCTHTARRQFAFLTFTFTFTFTLAYTLKNCTCRSQICQQKCLKLTCELELFMQQTDLFCSTKTQQFKWQKQTKTDMDTKVATDTCPVTLIYIWHSTCKSNDPAVIFQ